ncbi:MAG: helix-turn-helix domain-containing protein [Candidatus Dojkabacteria bacterium]
MEQNGIGDKTRELRSRRGLTQEDLARKADIPLTTLTKIENSVIKNTSIGSIKKIASALQLVLMIW